MRGCGIRFSSEILVVYKLIDVLLKFKHCTITYWYKSFTKCCIGVHRFYNHILGLVYIVDNVRHVQLQLLVGLRSSYQIFIFISRFYWNHNHFLLGSLFAKNFGNTVFHFLLYQQGCSNKCYDSSNSTCDVISPETITPRSIVAYVLKSSWGGKVGLHFYTHNS